MNKRKYTCLIYDYQDYVGDYNYLINYYYEIYNFFITCNFKYDLFSSKQKEQLLNYKNKISNKLNQINVYINLCDNENIELVLLNKKNWGFFDFILTNQKEELDMLIHILSFNNDLSELNKFLWDLPYEIYN
jgi:formyltetrahydrofolate hydrolase